MHSPFLEPHALSPRVALKIEERREDEHEGEESRRGRRRRGRRRGRVGGGAALKVGGASAGGERGRKGEGGGFFLFFSESSESASSQLQPALHPPAHPRARRGREQQPRRPRPRPLTAQESAPVLQPPRVRVASKQACECVCRGGRYPSTGPTPSAVQCALLRVPLPSLEFSAAVSRILDTVASASSSPSAPVPPQQLHMNRVRPDLPYYIDDGSRCVSPRPSTPPSLLPPLSLSLHL